MSLLGSSMALLCATILEGLHFVVRNRAFYVPRALGGRNRVPAWRSSQGALIEDDCLEPLHTVCFLIVCVSFCFHGI